jgi:hypothetical protein
VYVSLRGLPSCLKLGCLLPELFCLGFLYYASGRRDARRSVHTWQQWIWQTRTVSIYGYWRFFLQISFLLCILVYEGFFQCVFSLPYNIAPISWELTGDGNCRNAYANAGAMEARPLGRRPEVYYLSAFAAVDQCSPSNCVFNWDQTLLTHVNKQASTMSFLGHSDIPKCFLIEAPWILTFQSYWFVCLNRKLVH